MGTFRKMNCFLWSNFILNWTIASIFTLANVTGHYHQNDRKFYKLTLRHPGNNKSLVLMRDNGFCFPKRNTSELPENWFFLLFSLSKLSVIH